MRTLVLCLVLLGIIFIGCNEAGAITEVWVNCPGIANDYKVCSDCTLVGRPEWSCGHCHFEVKLRDDTIVQHSCLDSCTPEERR